jgi:PAS domain S-box-containing protein
MDRVISKSETLEVHDLTMRLEEAQDALCAIRSGEVDALVVSADQQPHVFILKGADHAHHILFETLNEGALTIAGDTTILCVNRRLAELLVRPLEELRGVRLVDVIAPHDVHTFTTLLGQTGPDGSRAEIALLTSRGDRVPVMVSIGAMMDGTEHFYTVVVNDLTELKEAQRALQRTNEELEARVEARTKEIERANEALRTEIAERTRLEGELRQQADELVEADRRKDEFLSMLAHELRNPLAPLLAAAELLRRGAHEPPALERYRSLIERQVRHLTRLVDDLLDVSRITRRVITLRTQPVELSAVVRSAVEASRPLIEAKGHELSVSLPTGAARVLVDPMRFEQVLVNLLNNAAKYTERGGRIHLSAEKYQHDVVLRVGDNGMGIPKELLPRIFDLFVQGERSLDRSQGGLGIGLTLVKSLVEMHGGRVEAHSDGAGKGSEFVIHLPSGLGEEDKKRAAVEMPVEHGAAMAADGAAVPAHAGSAPPRRRVLVVEDNADAMALLVELIELWGHDVRPACNGVEALRLAAEFRPHTVLIDIGLPGMDGYEVARRLRSLDRPTGGEPGEHPTVIAITGYGQERDRDQGAEAGFDHYLVKPPDPGILQKLLDRDVPIATAQALCTIDPG